MPIKIYYDGLCHLCSREINHYRSQEGAENITFVDITDLNFNAATEGLDPIAIHREFHVRLEDGSVVVGVEAFLKIWSVLPRYQYAEKIARRTPVKKTLEAGYFIFSRIRPLLPQKKRACESSPYCETRV